MIFFLLLTLSSASARNITFVNITTSNQIKINNILDFICDQTICSFNGGLELSVIQNAKWDEKLAEFSAKQIGAVGYYSNTKNVLLIRDDYVVPEVIIHEFYHYFTLRGFEHQYKVMFNLASRDLYSYIKSDEENLPHWLTNQQEFGATMFQIWFNTMNYESNYVEEISPNLYKLFNTYFPNKNICNTQYNNYSWCHDNTLYFILLSVAYLVPFIILVEECTHNTNYALFGYSCLSIVIMVMLILNYYDKDIPIINLSLYGIVLLTDVFIILFKIFGKFIYKTIIVKNEEKV